MPIKIPEGLPAEKTLEEENIFTINNIRADMQDIRPLRLLLLNLMPTKIVTETQLARILGNTPLQVELEFIHTSTHVAKNTSSEHLIAFYKTFDKVKHEKYDGMIITGAPVEHLEFEEVAYWDELCEIMEWSKTHVTSTFHICWGAQAGLYYHHGIKKYPLDKKMLGIFEHTVDHKTSILFRGFDDCFWAPHSRYTTILREDVEACPDVKILASSKEAGIYVCATERGRQIFVTGHPEYDGDTLKKEFIRDTANGVGQIPKNYFPDDDPEKDPIVRWRSCANLLYTNWLNYFVHQAPPYDIQERK